MKNGYRLQKNNLKKYMLKTVNFTKMSIRRVLVLIQVAGATHRRDKHTPKPYIANLFNLQKTELMREKR